MTIDAPPGGPNSPVEHYLQVRDLRLCYFEWGLAAHNQPTYLLVHATGFHARCWDGVVRELLKHQPDAHVVALDMRGHGRTDKTPPFNWTSFGADLIEFAAELDLRGVIGSGHSMGGHALLQCAAAQPERFNRLLLVDPVVLDPQAYVGHDVAAEPQDHPTSRRKAEFDSWQAMRDRFASRRPFSLWQADVLDDYCQYGLLPSDAGGDLSLACPPLVEASVYVQTTGKSIEHLLGRIHQSVTVLRAKKREGERDPMDFSDSPTWPGLAAALPQGVDLYLPELTHFIIMQAPAMVAHCLRFDVDSRAEIAKFLDRD